MKFKNLEFAGTGEKVYAENDKQLKEALKNSLAHQVNPDYFPEYSKVRDELKSSLAEVFKCRIL